MGNREAAQAVFSVAALLETQGANPYRIRAYRRAALGLLGLPDDARQHLNDRGELELPWLGPRLRRKLGELLSVGRMQFHVDLVAELPPVYQALLAVPGIGPKLATLLVRELRLADPQDLAVAARQGRLRGVRGIGPIRERRLLAAVETISQAA